MYTLVAWVLQLCNMLLQAILASLASLFFLPCLHMEGNGSWLLCCMRHRPAAPSGVAASLVPAAAVMAAAAVAATAAALRKPSQRAQTSQQQQQQPGQRQHAPLHAWDIMPRDSMRGTVSSPGHPGSHRAPLVYVPAMGKRVCVAAKLYGDVRLEDLAPDWEQRVQLPMRAMGWDVLHAAARTGCVSLRLDMLQQPALCPPHAHLEDVHQQVADALLPTLQQLLPGMLADGTPGLQVQLGHIVFEAQWDAAAATWTLLPHRPAPRPAPVAQLSLGVLQQVHAGRTGTTVQPASGQGGKHSSTSTAAAGPASSPAYTGSSAGATVGPVPDCAQQQGVQVLTVQAQLVAAVGSHLPTTADLASVVGWAPPVAGQHEQVPVASWRLLASAGTSYVPTCVLEVVQLPGGRAGACASLKVELQVPHRLLPRHHAGGPPVGLLPVQLELWRGETLLSSSSLLLQLPGSCWWWGAAGAATCHAVHELQLKAQELGAGMLLPPELSAWHAFNDDLALWLAQIRSHAVLSGHCTSSAAADAAWPPALGSAGHAGGVDGPEEALACLLPAEQLDKVRRSLLRFAARQRLPRMQQLVQQQQRQVILQGRQQPQTTDDLLASYQSYVAAPAGQPWKAGSAAGARDSEPAGISSGSRRQLAGAASSSSRNSWATWWGGMGTRAATVARSLHEAVLGAACEQCEAHSRQEMGRMLAGIQVVPCALMASMGAVHTLRCIAQGDYATPTWVLPWLLLHASLAAILLLLPLPTPARGPDGSAEAPPAQVVVGMHKALWCSRLCGAAYALRMCAFVLLGKKVGALIRPQLQSGVYLINRVVIALGEQAPATQGLHSLHALAVSVADGLLQLHAAHTAGGLSLSQVAGLMLAVVLPRLLLVASLRAMLRHSPTPRSPPDAAGCCKASKVD